MLRLSAQRLVVPVAPGDWTANHARNKTGKERNKQKLGEIGMW